MVNELKVLIFIDHANLRGQAAEVNRRLDLVKLTKHLSNTKDGRWCIDCIVYTSLPVDNAEGDQKYHDYLRHSGFQVISKRSKKLPNGRIKGDMDIYLALDAVELACEIRPDIIVLGTGDGDMAPLALRIRRLGIRVEVASGTQSLAGELRAACQGVINLDDFLADCEPLNGEADAIGSSEILVEVQPS